MLLSIMGMCSVVYIFLSGGDQMNALLVAAGSMCVSCLATWLGRGSDPDDDWGGGPGYDEPNDDLPDPGGMHLPEWDWEDFDQERRSWDNQPTQV